MIDNRFQGDVNTSDKEISINEGDYTFEVSLNKLDRFAYTGVNSVDYAEGYYVTVPEGWTVDGITEKDAAGNFIARGNLVRYSDRTPLIIRTNSTSEGVIKYGFVGCGGAYVDVIGNHSPSSKKLIIKRKYDPLVFNPVPGPVQCGTTQFSFSVNPVHNAGYYDWEFPPGWIPQTVRKLHTDPNPNQCSSTSNGTVGTVTVTAKIVDIGNPTKVGSITLDWDRTLGIKVGNSTTPPFTVCTGSTTVVFTTSPGNSYESYQWVLGNEFDGEAAIYLGESLQFGAPPSSTIGTVNLTATSACGFEVQKSVDIIFGQPKIVEYEVFGDDGFARRCAGSQYGIEYTVLGANKIAKLQRPVNGNTTYSAWTSIGPIHSYNSTYHIQDWRQGMDRCHYVGIKVTNACGTVVSQGIDRVCPDKDCRRGGIITPDPAVAGTDAAVTAYFFKTEEEDDLFEEPIAVTLLDERKEVLFSGTTSTGSIIIPVSGLASAQYVLNGAADGQTWEVPVMLVENGKVITASPNPARVGVDDTVTINVRTSTNTEKYHFKLKTFGGQVLWSGESFTPSVEMPLAGISPGTYQIEVSDGQQTWTEDLDYLVENGPYLTVSPNPADDEVEATIADPVYPNFEMQWQVIRVLNGDTALSGTCDGPTKIINTSQLPAEQYIIKVNEGQREYSKHVQVSH